MHEYQSLSGIDFRSVCIGSVKLCKFLLGIVPGSFLLKRPAARILFAFVFCFAALFDFHMFACRL